MTDESKGYEKPFFKEYRALVDEVEKLPASDQETKIVNMIHDLYNQMQENIEAQEGISEIQQLVILDNRSELSALKEAQRWIPVSERLPEDIPGQPPELLEIVTDKNVYYAPVVFTVGGHWNFNDGYSWRELDWSVNAVKWRKLPQPPESES